MADGGWRMALPILRVTRPVMWQSNALRQHRTHAVRVTPLWGGFGRDFCAHLAQYERTDLPHGEHRDAPRRIVLPPKSNPVRPQVNAE